MAKPGRYSWITIPSW